MDNQMRFYVKENTANSFGVYDVDWARYYQPSNKAVTLYFDNKMEAQQIADIMNHAWLRFMSNPK